MEKHYDTDGINVYLMLTDTDYQVSYEPKITDTAAEASIR